MSKRQSTQTSVVPRVKVWLEVDGDYVFGRGICDILRAVDDTGSIKDAAKEVGKSYRHVWSRIKEAEEAMGAPLVLSKVGGKIGRRSELTLLANELVDGFLELRQKIIDDANENFAKRFPKLGRAGRRG